MHAATHESLANPQLEPTAAPPQRAPERHGVRREAPLLRAAAQAQAPNAHAALLGAAAAHGPAQVGALAQRLQRRFGNSYVQRTIMLARKAADTAEVTPEVEAGIQGARGAGQPLDHGLRAHMEPAFGADFGGVRVHTDTRAHTLNTALSARAFTTGQDVFFRAGEYNPATSGGQELIAHELTHVVQQAGAVQAKLTLGAPDDQYEQAADATALQVMQRLQRARFGGAAPEAQRQASDEEEEPADSMGGSGLTAAIQRRCADCAEELEGGASLAAPQPDELVGGGRLVGAGVRAVQRDLAVKPPNPTAVAAELTAPQMEAALRYNQIRFKDPYSIAVIRDVIGIARFPAVADEAFAQAIAQWQAEQNLTVNGKCGPAATRTLVGELRAEGNPRDATQLRTDNYVSWSDVNGPTFRTCSGAVHGFQWDVNFSTSLRRGWIIQELTNIWSPANCNGTAYGFANATPHYYEAWWVDNAGKVWIPTSLTTPPTIGTPAIADDQWRRPMMPGTSGTWRMSARLFTTLTLPAGLTIGGVADAIALPSSAGTISSDTLGLLAASRSIGGEWNCCDPNPALHFHRRR